MRTSGPNLLFLALYFSNLAWTSPQTRSSLPPDRSFDYVVVGGGTAGLTVASRLSEDPWITVAVVEAGTFPEDVVGNISQVPAYQPFFVTTEVSNHHVEWGFKTTPQAGQNNATVSYYRAKTLGGCSAINSMFYCHSSRGAFQLWAETVGDQSYTYDNVVQYYHKSMNFTAPDSAQRGANATPLYNVADTVRGGPLAITYSSYAQSWSTWVAKGLEAIGIHHTDAIINGNLMGSTWMVQTINHSDGFRASSESAYLRPYLSRPNLALFDGTLAERIIFNQQKVATGVEVTTADTTYTLAASKEVIISAGAFQSPQLLMVSGVGPLALLQQHNITVIAERPGLGQDMGDHILVPITYQVNLATTATEKVTVQAVDEFNTFAAGPLASAGGDYIGLEKIPQELRANFSAETVQFLSKLPNDWPEVQYLPLPVSGSANTTVGANYASAIVALLAPQSRGNISIVSCEMNDAPLINPNWFTAQSDIDVMLAGFKRIRQLLTSKAMASVVVGEEFFPGLGVQTDDQIVQYIRTAFQSFSHASSTCKMGKASDPNAVVDSYCKVYGVKNLRVIDASAFPFLPPGPAPQSHIYMLAEKIADEIKKGN